MERLPRCLTSLSTCGLGDPQRPFADDDVLHLLRLAVGRSATD